MARTAAGAALTASHLQLQRRITAQVLGNLLRLWPAVDTQAPSTFDLFNEAATVLVIDGHRMSAGLATRYFTGFRIAEGIAGETPVPRTFRSPTTDLVGGLLRGAAITGILNARSAGFGASAERAQGWVQLAGQAANLVQDGGRDALLEAVGEDRQVEGWQRVTFGGCAFCAMLASRGPVYSETSGAFLSHDHCRCTVEPVYAGSRLPPQSATYRDLWNRVTDGLSGPEAYSAFRQAIDAPADAEDQAA